MPDALTGPGAPKAPKASRAARRAADAPRSADLEFAVALSARAGEILMDRYERLERIHYKSARDVVTEADHMSEELIIESIKAYHPTDAILAEESGEHHAVAGEAPTSGKGRVWIIDPLDGTVNYANGIPFFCVSIGLVVDGVPSVGVVHDPTRGETFAATADGPAMLMSTLGTDSFAIQASDKDKLSDFVVSMALSGRAVATRARNVRKAIRIPRSMGSAALALSYVGNGRFDAFIQQGGLSAWDIAAAGLIAERGGARVTSIDGGAWFDVSKAPRSIGVLAAPDPHHAGLLALVR